MISINSEQFEKLEDILGKYSSIFSDKNKKDLVLETFKFKRPIISIKINTENKDWSLVILLKFSFNNNF